jgi:hypothetical protein
LVVRLPLRKMFRRGALFGLDDVDGHGDAEQHGQHYSDDQVDSPVPLEPHTLFTPRHGQGDTVHDDRCPPPRTRKILSPPLAKLSTSPSSFSNSVNFNVVVTPFLVTEAISQSLLRVGHGHETRHCPARHVALEYCTVGGLDDVALW